MNIDKFVLNKLIGKPLPETSSDDIAFAVVMVMKIFGYEETLEMPIEAFDEISKQLLREKELENKEIERARKK